MKLKNYFVFVFYFLISFFKKNQLNLQYKKYSQIKNKAKKIEMAFS